MRYIRGSLDQLQLLIPVSVGAVDTQERVTCTALIDTGATRTCITPRLIEQLQLKPRGKLLVSSATSYPERRQAYGYTLGLFCSSEHGGETLYVIGAEFIAPSIQDNSNFDVLLGMDLLTQGRLTVENARFEFAFAF